MKTYIDTVSGETLFIQERSFIIRHYKDSKCTIVHRVDGPAIIYNDKAELWQQNGLNHRVDGPAYVSKYIKKYCIEGKEFGGSFNYEPPQEYIDACKVYKLRAFK